MTGRLLALLAGGACAAAACDAKPKPLPCPGEVVGVFQVTGTPLKDAAWCPFVVADDTTRLTFSLTLAWGGEGEAIVCLDRPEADPLRGPRSGDTITVTHAAPAYAPTCACATTVAETLQATVRRAPDGAVVGLDGTLADELAPTVAGTACEKPAPARACGVPCRTTWTLSGSR